MIKNNQVFSNCDDTYKKEQGGFKRMLKQVISAFMLLLLLMGGHAYASLYAEAQLCSSTTGEVLEVTNDEIFKIAVCNQIKVFKEFSYCYGVEKGDRVSFDSNPGDCEMTGFTVMRNAVQCGVLCQ